MCMRLAQASVNFTANSRLPMVAGWDHLLLQSAAIIFYASTYLVMFAIPIIGLRGVKPRPPLWLRIAACSGFLMTLLNLTLSIFPIVEVKNQTSFTLKVSAVTVAANVAGAAIFLLAEKRRRSQRADVVIAPAD